MNNKQMQLQKVLTDIAKEIQGTIGISLVQLSSGMPFASISSRPNFNMDVAAAYDSEAIKQKQRAVQALKQDEKVEQIIVTLTSQVHVINFIDEDHFLCLAVDTTNSSNIGLIKVVLEKNLKEILDIIKSF